MKVVLGMGSHLSNVCSEYINVCERGDAHLIVLGFSTDKFFSMLEGYLSSQAPVPCLPSRNRDFSLTSVKISSPWQGLTLASYMCAESITYWG